MSQQIAYTSNRASEAQIVEHLSRCDSSFVPPLSMRVEIDSYARKIASAAVRFEAWDRTLVGLLAAYCNDRHSGVAYITSVSVLEEWRGRKIASRLLKNCISHARAEGYRQVALEVDGENTGALSLYAKEGFTVSAAKDGAVIMQLDIGGEKG